MKHLFLIGFLILSSFTNNNGGDYTVYVAANGDKYHTADCKLSGNANEMTLADAKKAGKKACNVCKPNEKDKAKLKQCAGKTDDGNKCKRKTAHKSGKCFQHNKN